MIYLGKVGDIDVISLVTDFSNVMLDTLVSIVEEIANRFIIDLNEGRFERIYPALRSW